MSALTYILTIQITNYATIEDLKVAIIKTLARWFPNHYVFNEDAVESWVKKEDSDIDVLYGNTFQFEISVKSENVYSLTMYAVGSYRRQGSSCNFFERVLECLEYQLQQPEREFATMAESREKVITFWNFEPQTAAVPITESEEVVEADEDDEDTVASLDEESDDEDEDEDSDDEDERIMSMPLSHMNDAQIEKYVERIGRCPRDECDEWTTVYNGGDIIRYSYCDFSQWHIEDQTVSNVTITRAIFNETTFTNYVFDNVTFDECVFMDVILNNTTFKNSKFIECVLDSRVPDKSCEVINYIDDNDDDDHIHITYY
jgi:hypothetical protein